MLSRKYSGLKPSGNSLYFGYKTNSDIKETFCLAIGPKTANILKHCKTKNVKILLIDSDIKSIINQEKAL